jgi:hypothetical protein
MNLLNFSESFPDEESCKVKFKEYRDKQGVICSHCGGIAHYWKKDKWQYECKSCKTRTTLRSGTIMHGSQLPFRYWFVAIHLLTSTKKSFSAKEIQRQLGHKRYQPIWEMMHKLRIAMGKRDSKYQLTGQMELDEGFFSTIAKDEDKDKPLKRGRGSQKKTKVLVMAESIIVKDKFTKTGKPRKVRYIKMQVIENLESETITTIVENNVSRTATLDTDDSTSYVKLKNVVKEHNPKVIQKELIGKALPWVHIAISNSKRVLLDMFHGIKSEFLQYYLDEFCYNFNRRYYGEALFDRLLTVAVSDKNLFRYNRG